MRRIVVLACLLVAACDRPALSRKPLLQAANPPTVTLRDGVWSVGDGDADCKVDRTAPVQAWPDCASWTLIAQGRIVRPPPWRALKLGFASVPFVISDGDPPLMQEPDRAHPGYFTYHTVHPLGSDPQGRIIAAEVSGVNCPPLAETGKPQIVIPGVSVRRDACYVADAPALQRLVALDHDPASHFTMRWLRDGDR